MRRTLIICHVAVPCGSRNLDCTALLTPITIPPNTSIRKTRRPISNVSVLLSGYSGFHHAKEWSLYSFHSGSGDFTLLPASQMNTLIQRASTTPIQFMFLVIEACDRSHDLSFRCKLGKLQAQLRPVTPFRPFTEWSVIFRNPAISN